MAEDENKTDGTRASRMAWRCVTGRVLHIMPVLVCVMCCLTSGVEGEGEGEGQGEDEWSRVCVVSPVVLRAP
jgi:hypothetical protein